MEDQRHLGASPVTKEAVEARVRADAKRKHGRNVAAPDIEAAARIALGEFDIDRARVKIFIPLLAQRRIKDLLEPEGPASNITGPTKAPVAGNVSPTGTRR